MSSLTALTQSERTELRNVDVIQLVHITLPSGLVLYFSDIDYAYNYTSGITYYDSYIVKINGLGNVIELEGVMNPSVNIVLKNKPWADYSYLINLRDDDEFTRADIAIYEVRPITLDEVFSSDVKTLLWKGNVKQVEDIGLDTFQLTCCSRLHNKKNAFNLQTVDEDTFPDSHPPDRGKYRNKVYGSVDKVLSRNIVSGAMDRLTTDLTIDQTTVYISGSNEIPFTSSGQVQVDLEVITYTGITTSGSRQIALTGCTRATGSGDGAVAAIHDKGAYIGQVLTSFIYEIADHPVQEIQNVFVDDIRQTGSDIPFVTYTGQTGNELTGYEGTAVVRFTTQPFVGQQVNVDVNDHEHSTDTGSHSHGSTSGTTDTGVRLTGSSTATWAGGGGIVIDPSNAWDGNTSTYAYVSINNVYNGYDYSSVNIPFRIVIPSGYTLSSVTLTYTASAGSSETHFKIACLGHSQSRIGIFPYGDYTFSFVDTSLGAGTYTVTASMYHEGVTIGSGYGMVRFGEISMQYTYSSSSTGYSPAVGVDTSKVGTTSLSGGTSTSTIVIGNEVTADVLGYQDDALGTYTGTPEALITRPDHIYKHLLQYQAGFLSSDIDTTTFNTAGSFYSTNTYNYAFVLHDIGTESDKICGNLAYQCHSMFYEWNGKFYLKVLPSTTPSSSLTIYNEDILEYPRYSFTNLDDIKNYLRGFYLRDYRNNKGGSSLEGVLNPDAMAEGYMDVLIASTGDEDLKDDLHLNAIRLSAMAGDVTDFWLNYKSAVKLSIDGMKVRWKGIQIGPGDYFTYTDPMFGIKIYRVTTFKPDRTAGHILISGVEAP